MERKNMRIISMQLQCQTFIAGAYPMWWNWLKKCHVKNDISGQLKIPNWIECKCRWTKKNNFTECPPLSFMSCGPFGWSIYKMYFRSNAKCNRTRMPLLHCRIRIADDIVEYWQCFWGQLHIAYVLCVSLNECHCAIATDSLSSVLLLFDYDHWPDP